MERSAPNGEKPSSNTNTHSKTVEITQSTLMMTPWSPPSQRGLRYNATKPCPQGAD